MKTVLFIATVLIAVRPFPAAAAGHDACRSAMRMQKGVASWYAPALEGRKTASGELYDPGLLTAAHMTLPINTKVRVTNRRNGRSVVLRINDRGPFVQDRVIDLSQAAAAKIGMRDMAAVRINILCPDDGLILVRPRRKPRIE